MLTNTHLQIIRILRDNGPIPFETICNLYVSEATSKVGLSKSWGSKLTADLHRMGYTRKRLIYRNGQRVYLYEATPAAKRFVVQVQDQAQVPQVRDQVQTAQAQAPIQGPVQVVRPPAQDDYYDLDLPMMAVPDDDQDALDPADPQKWMDSFINAFNAL